MSIDVCYCSTYSIMMLLYRYLSAYTAHVHVATLCGNCTKFIITVYIGGGVELPSHYPQWKLEYYKLEAPSALQISLNKLVEGT